MFIAGKELEAAAFDHGQRPEAIVLDLIDPLWIIERAGDLFQGQRIRHQHRRYRTERTAKRPTSHEFPS